MANPLQSSCPENPTDRGAWWAMVLGVTKSRPHAKGVLVSCDQNIAHRT